MRLLFNDRVNAAVELISAGGNLIAFSVGQRKIGSFRGLGNTNLYPVPVVVCRFGIKAHRILLTQL